MKVQVNVKTPKGAADAQLKVAIGASDTVASVKERLVAAQLIPFNEQDLMLDGEVLEDGWQLYDCGLKDTSSLDFVVRASDELLVQQLSELLRSRDLSCDELGLLYCYKHGVSISQALKFLGHEQGLQEFVRRQKDFQLESSIVALVREDTLLKPFSVTAEVEQLLKAAPSGTLEMKELCSRFMRKFGVSLASIVAGKPADFLARHADLFVVPARGTVSLKSAHGRMPTAWPAKPPAGEWPQLEGQQWPAEPPVDAPPGLALQPRPLLEAPVDEVAAAEAAADKNQQYLDLHSKICNRAFNSQVGQAVNEVAEAVSEVVFLNVDRVVRGGAVCKGTAISGAAGAELVFFVKGLPLGRHEKWLPPLLRSVESALQVGLSLRAGVRGIALRDDCVQVTTTAGKAPFVVELRFSPVCGTYEQAMEALGQQGPEARHFFAATLAEQRVQFIARQPAPVKVTIRLLKWWRDQQSWSGTLATPSDELLELMAVYSAVQTKPADQRRAIANVMSLLSRFDELRIVWSNFYTKADIWAPLLKQRPLLMDPVNPFVNIADPQAFDARELMAIARTTHFFW